MSFFEQSPYIYNSINEISQKFGLSANIVIGILVIILIWSMIWKLLGLWKSARKGSIFWFIVLALTNNVGILPILYIYVFSKINWNKFIQIEIKKSSKKKK